MKNWIKQVEDAHLNYNKCHEQNLLLISRLEEVEQLKKKADNQAEQLEVRSTVQDKK